ncbi:DNA mismatch repair protein MutS [Clostridium thermarum]|uniref:DNA mismatch repair protein MutS n=1 Tax=Clostridium thermarum TaxID=1716543 RepID=UPI0013D58CC7|nr:DNA mismatch repair protein MutS [Clostridium thermarum]
MALTPMMQQYLQIKEKNKDCILFFRLGDFYEMFFEDAQIASRELELVLTGRDCGLEERAPMCGIPYHAANNYISRLVAKGYKIAICEQLEDPALAKGIVKRDITKIITPGTFTDSAFLEHNKNNYILSIFLDQITDICGLCFSDLSTGEFYATSFNMDYSLIIDEIYKFSPREMLVDTTLDLSPLNDIINKLDITVTTKDSNYFTDGAYKNLSHQFPALDINNYDKATVYSANSLLNYIFETQKISLSNINTIDYYEVLDYMNMDINSRRNLELTENIRDKSKKDSLLWILDKTNTAMGSRMLRKWIEQPLINEEAINQRLDAVETIKEDYNMLSELKDKLKNVYDMERICGKVSSQSVNAKEMLSLKHSIKNIPEIKQMLAVITNPLLNLMEKNMDTLEDIYELLDRAIADNPPLTIKEGNIIKEGYDSEIDTLRKAKAHGKEWIAALENQEREVTGIKSLKVGYNKVFGYYIEISKANYASIPDGRYIRKQTLSNAERFVTQELKEMEEKILGAEEKLYTLEYSVFINIRNIVEQNIDRLKKTARLISQLDCLVSLAEVALQNNYNKPIIKKDGCIRIVEGRHPVIEKVIKEGTFISNDSYLDNEDNQMLLITGPNMAGKSTYMRQIALITLMAQIGSFVPAKSAEVSICDRIFTRIGASDDLSSGKSTFMVEMSEVANILAHATKDSLVLLDEVGRGTSTYDGLSIAWSVIEYICNKLRSKTLFATHYHELTHLEDKIKGVKNYCVSVKEIGNEIVFLRKIIPGGADQSYGIEVAKLAGLPEMVIQRSKEILADLESKNKVETAHIKEAAVTMSSDVHSKPEIPQKVPKKESQQLNFMDLQKDIFIEEISSIDILNITPMEAFNKLYEIVKKSKSI